MQRWSHARLVCMAYKVAEHRYQVCPSERTQHTDFPESIQGLGKNERGALPSFETLQDNLKRATAQVCPLEHMQHTNFPEKIKATHMRLPRATLKRAIASKAYEANLGTVTVEKPVQYKWRYNGDAAYKCCKLCGGQE